MSYMWMSHVSYVNEPCLICQWVMSHMSMSHVSYVNESCLICEWVMSHLWMSVCGLVTYTWDVSSHVSTSQVLQPIIFIWNMTHSHMRHDSFTYETWLIQVWQPIIFGVSFNLILQSQSNWSLFNGTRQKRRRELDDRLSFGIGETTLQMQ